MLETNIREWYWGLRGYGSYLKKILPNPNLASKHYTRQSPFATSLRKVRGAIIALLTESSPQSLTNLQAQLNFEPTRIQQALASLTKEGLIKTTDHYVTLP